MRAKLWVKELQRQASPNIVIALSGNKADLASKRMVDFEVSTNQQGADHCVQLINLGHGNLIKRACGHIK